MMSKGMGIEYQPERLEKMAIGGGISFRRNLGVMLETVTLGMTHWSLAHTGKLTNIIPTKNVVEKWRQSLYRLTEAQRRRVSH